MDETPVRTRSKTPKPQPSAFRQDLLRGLRWGTILLLVMLLSITAYRVLSSSPAEAEEPVAAQAVEEAPATAVAVDAPVPSKAAIQVGEAEIKTPAPAKARKPRVAAEVVVPEPPQRLHAPAFAPLPGIPPRPQPNTFVATPLPEAAPVPVAGIENPAPSPITPAPPPAAAEEPTQGNRATRAVRSVGRIFGIGRKRDEPTKEK